MNKNRLGLSCKFENVLLFISVILRHEIMLNGSLCKLNVQNSENSRRQKNVCEKKPHHVK